MAWWEVGLQAVCAREAPATPLPEDSRAQVPAASVPRDSVPRVLIAGTDEYSYTWASTFRTGMASYLRLRRYAVSLEQVSLGYGDAKADGSVGYDLEALRRRLDSNRYDLVVAVDDATVSQFLTGAVKLPSGVPLIFAGYSGDIFAVQQVLANSTGLGLQDSCASTIQLGLKIFPDTEKVLVLSDGFVASANARRIGSLRDAFGSAQVEHLDSVSVPVAEMLKKLRALPTRSFVVYVGIGVKGKHPNYLDSYNSIVDHLDREYGGPLFCSVENVFPNECWGGVVSDPSVHGAETAKLIIRVLGGESAGRILPRYGPVTELLNERVLARAGFGKNKVPSGVNVVDQVPTSAGIPFWPLSHSLCVIAVLALLVVALVSHRRSRSKQVSNCMGLCNMWPMTVGFFDEDCQSLRWWRGSPKSQGPVQFESFRQAYGSDAELVQEAIRDAWASRQVKSFLAGDGSRLYSVDWSKYGDYKQGAVSVVAFELRDGASVVHDDPWQSFRKFIDAVPFQVCVLEAVAPYNYVFANAEFCDYFGAEFVEGEDGSLAGKGLPPMGYLARGQVESVVTTGKSLCIRQSICGADKHERRFFTVAVPYRVSSDCDLVVIGRADVDGSQRQIDVLLDAVALNTRVANEDTLEVARNLILAYVAEHEQCHSLYWVSLDRDQSGVAPTVSNSLSVGENVTVPAEALLGLLEGVLSLLDDVPYYGIRDVTAEENAAPWSEYGVGSILFVPIALEKAVSDVVVICLDRPVGDLADLYLCLGASVATVGGVAVERAKLRKKSDDIKRERYAIIDQLSMPVFVYGREADIKYRNESAIQVFASPSVRGTAGELPVSLMRAGNAKASCADGGQGLLTQLQDVLAQGVALSRNVSMGGRDWIENVSCVVDEKGKPTMAFATLTDVTRMAVDLDLQRVLKRCYQKLAESGKNVSAMENVLADICVLYGVRRAVVVRLEPTGVCSIRLRYRAPELSRLMDDGTTFRFNEDADWYRDITGGEYVAWMDGTECMALLRPVNCCGDVHELESVKVWMMVAIHRQGRLAGIIALQSPTGKKRISEADELFMREATHLFESVVCEPNVPQS